MNVREDAKADGNSLKELVPVSAILVALVALFLGSEALANGTNRKFLSDAKLNEFIDTSKNLFVF